MGTKILKINNSQSFKHNYDVLIEQKGKSKVIATVLGWQDCQTQGKTKEEAVTKLRQMLVERLEKREIISLEIEIPQKKEHPWMKFAGMYQDNPLFDEVLEDIEASRQQIDKDELKQDYGND